MPCCPFPRLIRCAFALILAGTLVAARAAELGDASVRSYLGQPLVADIELTGLSGDEMSNLRVRLASPDVYRGANIAMSPVLDSLHLTIARRDRQQFLHVTTTRPVDANYLHLFLELSTGDRADVRAATLWLTADPNPAPPPPPPAPEPSLAAAEPDAMSPALAAAVARAHQHRAAAGQAPAEAVHLPHNAPSPAAAASCGTRYTAEQIRTCAVLDQKNGALTAQIVELEGKVKTLQEAITKPMPAIVPRHKAALPPVKEVKKPVSLFERFPLWMWVGGGGVLLLLIALVLGLMLLRRKKKARADARAAAAPDAKPGLFARLRARFKRRGKDGAGHGDEPKLG